MPILQEEIAQDKCAVRVKPGKLILVLTKRDEKKPWHELLRTQGIGDSECARPPPSRSPPRARSPPADATPAAHRYTKLTPDAGESVLFKR